VPSEKMPDEELEEGEVRETSVRQEEGKGDGQQVPVAAV
jgi:hypothetical protein